MTKQKVIVTLGRSGQVVRRDQFDTRSDGQLLSGGGKGLIRDRLGNNGESSSYSGGKRQHGVVDALRADKQIGKNDLRLKLMRKKRSLQIKQDAEELRNIDLRKKLQRNVRPSNTVRVIPPQQHRPPQGIMPRQRSPPRALDSTSYMESSKRSYTSWGMDELRPRSPLRVSRSTRGISPPRISSQMREVPSVRSSNASRSMQVRGDEVLPNYRTVGPPSLPLRAATESSQPVRPPPALTSTNPPSLYTGDEPSTVSGLLQSLGLSKYYIIFQAEEVDMLTLRQMGDIDLKEMGIPMGPRKKILLAIKSRTFRRPL